MTLEDCNFMSTFKPSSYFFNLPPPSPSTITTPICTSQVGLIEVSSREEALIIVSRCLFHKDHNTVQEAVKILAVMCLVELVGVMWWGKGGRSGCGRGKREKGADVVGGGRKG